MASGQPYRLSLFAAPQRKQARCRNLGRTLPMSKKVLAWRIKIDQNFQTSILLGKMTISDAAIDQNVHK